jgi:26S proteasome regulatory subunit N6
VTYNQRHLRPAPSYQGIIDLQRGLPSCQEGLQNFIHLFFEAFEALSSLEDPKAISSLKYVLLCKIMVSQADDFAGIISSKVGMKYLGSDVYAMKAVADAYTPKDH